MVYMINYFIMRYFYNKGNPLTLVTWFFTPFLISKLSRQKAEVKFIFAKPRSWCLKAYATFREAMF